MRLFLLAALGLASLSSAQTANNYFGIWTCTNFTSRGALGSNAGDNLIQLPASHFSGIAHDASGTGTVMTGFRHVLQDQNAATVQTYDIIIRADNGGEPDCSPAGVLYRQGPLTPPSGSGMLAWQLTISYAAPVTVLPLCATSYIGLSFTASPQWTADGLSSHMGSFYYLNGSGAGNPALNIPQVAHNCTSGTILPNPSNQSYRYEVITPAAVMNLYNEDPTLTGNTFNCVATANSNRDVGVGGMWPQIGGGRNDGLGCRVDDAANQGGVFACFFGVHSGVCPGLSLGSLAQGALYLNPTLPIVPVASGMLAPISGRGLAPIIPPGSAPASLVGQCIDFQAITLGPALTLPGKLTNRASACYLGVPAFSQVNVTYDGGAVPLSNWGSIDILVPPTPVGRVQYVNVVVDNRWEVQNAPVVQSEPASVWQSMTYNFNLNNVPGTRVPGVAFDSRVSAAPIVGLPGSLFRPTSASLGLRNVTMSSGLLGSQLMPQSARSVMGVVAQGSVAANAGPLVNQDCARGECAPTAASNNLVYLNGRYGLGLTALQVAIATMRTATGWVAGPPPGAPVFWSNLKDAFLRANNYPVVTTAVTNSVSQVMQALRSGCAVELSGTSHVAAVAGVVPLFNGKVAIAVKHDTEQGARGGTKTETVIWDPASNALDDGFGFDRTMFRYFTISCRRP